MIDRSGTSSTENATAVNIVVSNACIYRLADWYVRIELIKYLEMPPADTMLSHVTYLRASLCMNGFHYSSGSLSLTFVTGLEADDTSTLSTSGITVGCKVLCNTVKGLLLDICYRLKAM